MACDEPGEERAPAASAASTSAAPTTAVARSRNRSIRRNPTADSSSASKLNSTWLR